MNALAIILARAGSKGLPGKNRSPIAGKPCAQWTVEHALASRSVGGVVLSTDDPELITLAARCGVAAVHRSEALAGDRATVDAAAREALTQIDRAQWAAAPTRPLPPIHSPSTPIVLLYANVPVRPADLTDRAVDVLVSSGAHSVQSYAPVGKYHPWWMARVGDDGQVRPWEGEVLNHGVFRRQDLPPCHVPDGGVCCVTRAALELAIPGVQPGPHAFLGTHRRGVLTREGEVVDIDSRIDALVAAAILGGTPPADTTG